jgi:16S rRNA (guanine966-N2)-methyltransferase
MRIIGGIYKGRNLSVPENVDVRPALARMKDSLFNILMGEFEGKNVLDLFAGTGSLGFEAISRGARNCLFVENSQPCFESIKKNIAKLKLENVATVLFMDTFEIILHAIKNHNCFDYVFIDPPYKYYDDKILRGKLLGLMDDMARNNIITQNGMIIVEYRRGQINSDDFDKLLIVDTRSYGQTCLSFFRRKTLEYREGI